MTSVTGKPRLAFGDWPSTGDGWMKIFDDQYPTGHVDEVVMRALSRWDAMEEVKPPVEEAARKIAVALGYDPDRKETFGVPLWFRYKERAEDELIAVALGRPLGKRQ
jgi:hypothetical protein